VLRYAGELKSADAAGGIALLFVGSFDSNSDIASYITVTGPSGPVTAAWQVGSNPALVFMPGLASGKYRVRIKSGLKDTQGKTLKSDLSGSVTVKN
jgi:hypothetical protein